MAAHPGSMAGDPSTRHESQRRIGGQCREDFPGELQQHLGTLPIRCRVQTGQFHLAGQPQAGRIITHAIFPSLGTTG